MAEFKRVWDHDPVLSLYLVSKKLWFRIRGLRSAALFIVVDLIPCSWDTNQQNRYEFMWGWRDSGGITLTSDPAFMLTAEKRRKPWRKKVTMLCFEASNTSFYINPQSWPHRLLLTWHYIMMHRGTAAVTSVWTDTQWQSATHWTSGTLRNDPTTLSSIFSTRFLLVYLLYCVFQVPWVLVDLTFLLTIVSCFPVLC